MTFLWLAAIWAAVPMGLFGAVVWVRRRTLARVGGAHSIAKYVVVSLIDHATFATEGTGLTLLAGDALPTSAVAGALCGGLYAACIAHMALDMALFLQGGVRMQWQFIAFGTLLKDFAKGRAWRLQAAGIVVAAATLWGGSGHAFTVLLTERGKTPDWELLVAIPAAMALSTMARRTLPVFFMYEWTNAAVVLQVKACTLLVRRLRRRAYHHLRDAAGVPRVLVPQNVASVVQDPHFPLLRTVQRFEGARHFEVGTQAVAQPHVVMIFLESVRAKDVGALGAKHRVTPHLDALCKHGVVWERFYANGTYTAPALTAALYGLLPRFVGTSLQMHLPPIHVRGMPHLFAEAGYSTAFFSDGPMEWENKREFFLRNGYQCFYGPPSILDRFPTATPNKWNFDDAFLMRFHADWLAEQAAHGRPTFSTLLTVTNHHPFQAPPGAAAPDTTVAQDSEYYRYLRTTQYTDQCLGDYVQMLKDRGLYDKTVLVIAGDHGQQVTPEEKMDWSGQYNDGGVHVPLVMVAPGRLPAGKRIRELGSHIDLVPTMMDLFNMHGAQHACGTSLLRKNDQRQAITLHPWKPGLFVNRFGDFRYVHSLENGVAALYDLARDPHERRDVAAQYPDLFKTQQQQVGVLRDYLEEIYMANRITPAAMAVDPRLPRLPDDKAWAPQAQVEIEARIRAIAAASREGRQPSTAEVVLVGLYGMCLSAPWMTTEQQLRLAQCGAHRLARGHLGEMTTAERIELATLLMALRSPPPGSGLPAWLEEKIGAVMTALA
jgi:arylsulfatase A-like enzyme